MNLQQTYQEQLVPTLKESFGLKNNLLASLDILLVLGTLIWGLYIVWHTVPELRWVVYANIPYLLWGTFATFLQLTITYLNR